MTNSPTFVATFVDGVTARMTTYCELKKLDVGRSVRLSKQAYRSRMRKEPPQIVEAKFENTDGKLLATYTAEQIECAASVGELDKLEAEKGQ
jgi:hypothetical protein